MDNDNTILIFKDGTVGGYGHNAYGQLGNGTSDSPQLTLYKLDLEEVKEVCATQRNTVFLLEDGTVRTCGLNTDGQCGVGKSNGSEYDLCKPDIENVKQVSAGRDHTVFLLEDGTVRSCGSNQFGQCGTGDKETPVLELYKPQIEGVKQISCGEFHTVFLLNDGTVRTCGNNIEGECVTGGTSSPQLELYKPDIENVKQVNCGAYYTFFLLKDGTVRACGYNKYGVCGNGKIEVRQLELVKPDIENVKYISCGLNHTVFLLKDGTVRTCGYNAKGQCGNGDTNEIQLELYKPDIDNVKQVFCGKWHTVFLLKDGTIRTCGDNNYGQCGTGDTNTPVLELYKPDIDNVECIGNKILNPIFLFKRENIFGYRNGKVVVSDDPNHVPSREEFIKYGSEELRLPENILSESSQIDILTFYEDIIDGNSLEIKAKHESLVEGKKILFWTDDDSSEYNKYSVIGDKIQGYKTQISIDDTVKNDYEEEYQYKDKRYSFSLEEFKADSNIKTTVIHENEEIVDDTFRVTLNKQRNFSLKFGGESGDYVYTKVDFDLTDKSVQVIVKPEDGSWGVRDDFETFVKKENEDLIIGRGIKCTIDEVRIWEESMTKEFQQKPLKGDEEGLVLYYRFNEFAGNEVFDSAGKYNGYISGNVDFVDERFIEQNSIDAVIENDLGDEVKIIPKDQVLEYNMKIKKPQMPCTTISNGKLQVTNEDGYNIEEYSLDKSDYEEVVGIEILKDKRVLITGKKKTAFDCIVKIAELNQTLDRNFNMTVDFEKVINLDSSMLTQSVSAYTNSINIHQEDGYIVKKDNKVRLYNNEPNFILGYVEDSKLTLQLGDEDGDKIKFKLDINGKPFYPGSGYTELQKTPINYERKILSSEIKIGEINTIKVYVMDEYGVEITHNITFVGEYKGLMFCDEEGKYYSSDLGEILKRLDFGVINAGNKSKIKEIKVKNTLGYTIKNLNISVEKDSIPRGNKVKISTKANPFYGVDSIKYPMIVQNGQEHSFFIQIETKVLDSEEGTFRINASALPVL